MTRATPELRLLLIYVIFGVTVIAGTLVTTHVAHASESAETIDVTVDAEPIRGERPIGFAIDPAWLITFDGYGATLPIPGLRFDYAILPNLSLEVRYHTLILVNLVHAGARWWILDGNFTPTLFADVGIYHSVGFEKDGPAKVLPTWILGGSIDYVFDFGLSLSAEVALVGTFGDEPMLTATPGFGYRF